MGAKKRSAEPGWSEAEARDVLAAWGKSGQTGAAYARGIGVVPQRLFYWRRRLETERGAPTFVPVVVTSKSSAAPVLITVVVGTARIEIVEASVATAAWVASLLGAAS